MNGQNRAGNKSILFTLQPSVYGLTEERKCSNWKLLSYGDFSGENILKTLDFNDFVQADAGKFHAGLFDEFEEWMQERKLQQKMQGCEQLKTGETKEAEIYEEDEYKLY